MITRPARRRAAVDDSDASSLATVDVPVFRLSEALAPQIFRALRQAIVMLRVKPNQALSETEIAQRFGVSRQPVREAFIKLGEAGLVEIRPQRGTFVVPITRRDVMNARFIREAVEVAVVGELANKSTPATIKELRKLIDQQRAAASGNDWPAFLALDEAFHRRLAESAGHSHAWAMLEAIKAQMDRVRYLSFSGASPFSAAHSAACGDRRGVGAPQAPRGRERHASAFARDPDRPAGDRRRTSRIVRAGDRSGRVARETVMKIVRTYCIVTCPGPEYRDPESRHGSGRSSKRFRHVRYGSQCQERRAVRGRIQTRGGPVMTASGSVASGDVRRMSGLPGCSIGRSAGLVVYQRQKKSGVR
jgi:DNA-binding GntR family transcriptional regulator